VFIGSFRLLGLGSWKLSGGEVKKSFIVFISTTCRLSTCFLGFFLAEFFIFFCYFTGVNVWLYCYSQVHNTLVYFLREHTIDPIFLQPHPNFYHIQTLGKPWYTRVRKVLVTSDVSRSLDSLKLGDCRSYLRGKKT
jgi:hypothetical protein